MQGRVKTQESVLPPTLRLNRQSGPQRRSLKKILFVRPYCQDRSERKLDAHQRVYIGVYSQTEAETVQQHLNKQLYIRTLTTMKFASIKYAGCIPVGVAIVVELPGVAREQEQFNLCLDYSELPFSVHFHGPGN